MHDSLKVAASVLIVGAISLGTVALGLGALQAFLTGETNVAIGGAALLGFGVFFGNWYTKNFEAETSEN